jgi:hypothetical protein
MSIPAMAGHGAYNEHATAQATAAGFGIDQLVAAARAAPSGPTGAVTIADYGASQGRNSLRPMSAAIDAIRQVRGSAQEIVVAHTDLPDNDFSTLFHTVADDPGSYLRPGVYPVAVGRSFYEQLLPTASVGLGWSSIAVHWLSRTPGALDGIWFASATAEQYDMWAAAAAADWRAFVQARAAELVPGAGLVIVVGSAVGEAMSRRSGAERAMATLRDALAAMAGDGLLSAGELASAAIPAWYRTAAEWHAPLAAAGLTMQHFEEFPLGDPLWDAAHSRQDPGGTDSGGVDRAYALSVAQSLRVSFGPSLLAGLPEPRRSAVATELFDRLAAAVLDDPGRPWFQWQLTVMVIAKPAR